LWKKEDSQWVFSKIEESKINNIIEEINKFAIKKNE
jgi:hypothetical protein